MRKSGLHKQISSIFDGVPVPSNGALSEDTEATEELTGLQAQDAADPNVQQETLLQASGSASVQQSTADSSGRECDPIPVVQIGRPMPLSKSKAVSKSGMKPGFSKQIKKTIFGAHSSLDPRQKKAGVLVGILSLVFGVVLFVSLGGVGKTQAVVADDTSSDQTTQSQAAKKTAQNWKSPESLPQDLRNATSPVSKSPVSKPGTEQQSGTETANSDQWVVKGIVFSKNKPSAIINNQIFSEGEVFNGITITKITKETVEFEANEKRWTQTVQR